MKDRSLSKWLVAMAVLLVLTGFSLPALADTLYLVNSPGGSSTSDSANRSRIYKVALSGTTATLSNARELTDGGTKLIAVCSLGYGVVSGANRLYFVDNYKPGSQTKGGQPLNSGKLGYCTLDGGGNPGSATISTAIMYSGAVLPEVSGAAFSAADGHFYVISQLNDALYTVDLTTNAATLVGVVKNTIPITDVTLNLNNGDIAFDPTNNDLYLWTDLNRGGNALRGLWKLTLPASDGVVSATYIGQPAPADWATVSGLAIDGDGTMYVSTRASGTIPSRIVVVDKTTGAFGAKYDMKVGTTAFTHNYGDLTVK